MQHRNIWEWCADRFEWDYFRKSPAEDPTGPDSGSSRVLRGGSWGLVAPGFFRCASRLYYDPVDWDSNGFRVSRTLTP